MAYEADRWTTYDCHYEYPRRTLQTLFDYARQHDVEAGGVYNAGSVVVKIWSHDWTSAVRRHESSLIGSLFFKWREPCILWQIEVDKSFAQGDLIQALGTLEERALGQRIHGQRSKP